MATQQLRQQKCTYGWIWMREVTRMPVIVIADEEWNGQSELTIECVRKRCSMFQILEKVAVPRAPWLKWK